MTWKDLAAFAAQQPPSEKVQAWDWKRLSRFDLRLLEGESREESMTDFDEPQLILWNI